MKYTCKIVDCFGNGVGYMRNDPDEMFASHTTGTADEAMQRLAADVTRYLGDEHNENPGCSTLRELYAAFGALYLGLASGISFTFVFQGDTFNIEIEE